MSIVGEASRGRADHTGIQSFVVAGLQYRFGPFVVDRARSHLLREDAVLELTSTLLDLLPIRIRDATCLSISNSHVDKPTGITRLKRHYEF